MPKTDLTEVKKLFTTLDRIKASSIECLLNESYVEMLVREAGLVRDERVLYGSDKCYMNPSVYGLWQIPAQLAAALVFLARYRIQSAIEVGTWYGWTSCFLGTYLTRFNEGFELTTLDIGSSYELGERIFPYANIKAYINTSAAFSGKRYDLAFIDGDHGYEACMRDYENVGRSASLCMFHDINDPFVRDYGPNNGGVPRAWREISAQVRDTFGKTVEFTQHRDSLEVMGIGIVVRNAARVVPCET